MIDVVAAVVKNNEKYLIAQKSLKKGGEWEFPGGKVEPGETLVQALTREIAEELGVAIEPSVVLATIPATIKGQTYRIHFMAAILINDQFQLAEHQAVQWATIQEMESIHMSSADLAFVEHIRSLP